MKFTSWMTAYEIGKREVPRHRKRDIVSAGEFYHDFVGKWTKEVKQKQSVAAAEMTLHQGLAEHGWMSEGKPFYNVWPGIVDYLLRIRLDHVPMKLFKLPMRQIYLRFAEDDPPL